MSYSHTVKGSLAANQRGARARRDVYNPGTSTTRQQQGLPDEQQGLPDEQHDSTPSQEPIPPETERYQRREAYTVIAPNEDKRQKLLRIHQQEEETARIRKEMKGKTPIKLKPKSVGGHRVSHQESIEQQQRLADKSPTAKALEMREKREKWKREGKEREDKEIAKKKVAARLQAEKNEKKSALHIETVRSHWDKKYSHKENSSSEEEDYDYMSSGAAQFQSQTEDRLVRLCRMFPDYDTKVLSELLHEQGSIARVRQLLEG